MSCVSVESRTWQRVQCLSVSINEGFVEDAETVSETFESNSLFTWLTAQEDFAEFSRREILFNHTTERYSKEYEIVFCVFNQTANT